MILWKPLHAMVYVGKVSELVLPELLVLYFHCEIIYNFELYEKAVVVGK
jgi:hypothetical protein